jgi:hypothetical protein
MKEPRTKQAGSEPESKGIEKRLQKAGFAAFRRITGRWLRNPKSARVVLGPLKTKK